MTPGNLLPTEWLMMAVFIVGVLSWGIYMKGRISDLSDSFLAGRKVPGIIASVSAIATNFNTNDFIGGVGAAYAMGLVMAHGSLLSGFVLIFICFVFLRQIRRLNVFTLGEWLRIRYSTAVGDIYSFVWVFVWMLINLGLYIYSGALVLRTLVGWNLFASIVLLTVVAATYTLLGGFGAVVATDVLQMVLMFFPFLFLVPRIWMAAGGREGILTGVDPQYVDIWSSQSPFGHIGIVVFGALFLSLSYWSSEAQMIQRPLSARSVDDAAVSYLGVGVWHTFIAPLIIVIPGIAALKLFPNLSNNDFAMPMLIKTLVPPGLYGVTIIGLMAGFLSSADSQINAFCTMFITDIYRRRLARNRSTAHYLRASKVSGAIFTAAAIGTAILFNYSKSGMMLMALSILATIMPPSAAVIIIGALWKKAGKTGALAGMLGGFATGIALITLDLNGKLTGFAAETLYLRALITFVVSTVLTVAVSAIMREGVNETYENTLSAADSEVPGVEPAGDVKRGLWENPKKLSIMLIISAVIVYTILTIIF